MTHVPYRVDEGVKRAKAAQMLGLPTIRAELRDRNSRFVRDLDVPLAGLLSRLDFIDRTLPAMRQKWDRTWDGMRRDPSAL